MDDPTVILPRCAKSYKSLSLATHAHAGERGRRDAAMAALEVEVAQTILVWLETHPPYHLLLDWIRVIPYTGRVTLDDTQHIRAPLWGAMDARRWLGPQEASGFRGMLWQVALVRLSAYLNTGSFDIVATVNGDAW